MGRGLDGYFYPSLALCGFQAPPGAVSQNFRWRIARGKHLFPFRTEQLSPSAPMVLGGQPPGRVGRRRFFVSQPALSCRAGCAFLIGGAWPHRRSTCVALLRGRGWFLPRGTGRDVAAEN